MRIERQLLYLDGRWVEAEDGRTFTVTDPATGEAVAEVADASPADARRAVEAAEAAFRGWAALPPKERGRILLRIQEGMEREREGLARLIVRENGKPLEEARREVGFALGYFGWFAEEARRVTGTWVPAPSPGRHLWVFRQPVGPVAAITPWNFPATMVTRKIAPALAAGCPVVLKPASATPLTALALARIAHEAGLPPGVLNVVPARRAAPVAEVFLGHPAIRKVAFTGSTEVGKWIMERAAAQMKRLSFELGGNAPFLVFADADLAAAVEAAVAIKFLRVGGQSCICANRLFVQEPVADRFLEAFLARVKALRVAPGFEPGAEVGPLINAETRDKVHGLVEDARARGARLLAGGHPLTEGALGRGFFYAPTVLADVTDTMPVCTEEIFGPVAPVATFRSEDEAVARANATRFGLAAYAYTRDLARVLRLAERLEYGLVGINDASGYTHEIPFGGFKESGLGREGGQEGIHEYTEVKSVVVVPPA